MNSAQIHLALSHFPLFGILTGLFILAYGYIFKKEQLSLTALIIFVVTAVIAIPVFLTGEDAGEIIKNLPGVSDSLKEAHEELAEKVIWLIGLLGVLSAAALYVWLKIRHKFKLACLIVIAMALISFGFLVKVGNSGGEIRHTEIRSPENPANQ